ncbi:MAG: hypothetical protein KIY12_04725 [Thermoplasmata archaeon]|uniref:Uncharacterized protein n=1 Tax=Candidatus Sysuiplasma superficiale TaxID=2823368 RepID=A0A8J7YRR7_9ARCH|nr:hypothetical protein [Candidatus Sysuiplasma superficiale]MBX8644011.1 hypothetical protein [Candidatus Sysuiplasma superficiale]
MQEERKSDQQEERVKEVIEHLYNAGFSSLSAVRAIMPSLPPGSRALKELKKAQKEMLLAARAFIDGQIDFLDKMDIVPAKSQEGRKIRKVEIRERK